MKISNKEKIMLCILGIILVGFVYYNYIYINQVNKIESKNQQKIEIEEKYNVAMATINALEDRKSDMKILKAKISDISTVFYPIISEEHIIIELDNLLNDSGLKGGITFEPTVSDIVENSEKETVNLKESSFQKIVDEYSNTKSDGKTNETAQEEVQSGDSNTNGQSDNSNESSNSANTSDENNSSQDTTEAESNTVQYLKCDVNFKGNYEALNKFLNAVAKNEKKIVANLINISQDSIDEIKGTIKLEIYAVPKIDDELESYLKWNLNNTYGKTVPFSTGAATGVAQDEKDINDFVVSAKSINSDMPTVMVGRANDSERLTYAYADSNSQEEVEIMLTQDGDKYYYKYKTSKESFPKNYNGVGVQFTPVYDSIVINVLSESRINSEDNSGVELNIINKTDKLVKVDINGEDKSDPRVTVGGDGSNVSVNQK